jgi:hypothetical protein
MVPHFEINFNLGRRQSRLAKCFWNFQTISKLYGIPVYKMTKISCKMKEDFLRSFFVKNLQAAALLRAFSSTRAG